MRIKWLWSQIVILFRPKEILPKEISRYLQRWHKCIRCTYECKNSIMSIAQSSIKYMILVAVMLILAVTYQKSVYRRSSINQYLRCFFSLFQGYGNCSVIIGGLNRGVGKSILNSEFVCFRKRIPPS